MRRFLAALALTGVAVLGGCALPDEPTGQLSEDTASPAETVAAHELAPGQCLNDVTTPLTADLTEVPTVPCDEEHESEVFAEIPIEAESYPGVDWINDRASEECEAAFGEFVGLDYRVSQLSFHYYYPEFSRWAEGERSIFCVVFDPAGVSTGSLAGSAR